LYSGTNPNDAIKSSFAFLSYLSKYSNVDFILTTHYTPVCLKFEEAPHSNSIMNYKMDVHQDSDGKLNFSYKLKPGICSIQGAIEILKAMEYPDEIIDTIMEFDNRESAADTVNTNNENIP
jgi:DNA mismatch repair ATPase MutS